MFSGLGATALSRPVLRRGGLTAGRRMPTSAGGAWFVLGSHPRAPDTGRCAVLGPGGAGTGSGSIHLAPVVETVTSLGLGVAEGGATRGTPLPVVLGCGAVSRPPIPAPIQTPRPTFIPSDCQSMCSGALTALDAMRFGTMSVPRGSAALMVAAV